MKHISILIPRGFYSLVNIEGAYQILSFVNEVLAERNQAPLFQVNLVGLSKNMPRTGGLFTIHPEWLIREVEKTDLIITPAIHGDLEELLSQNEELIPWIVKQYKEGAQVASLCIGTFLLAATGLLDGRPCTTHWSFANEFRKRFPEAILMDDKIITDMDGIYTSGGAYSFPNLIIYLIEKLAGRELAIFIAKKFMIDFDKDCQSPFMIFSGQKEHKDKAVLGAQEYIEKNFQGRITVHELSCNFGMSRRTFERRFKKATANTVVEYVQRVKIEAAKQQLESGRKTVAEVMYDVGYTDTKAFRDVFKKITGMSPVDYRNKYNKEVLPVAV